MSFLDMLSQIGITEVIIILGIGIPSILKFINWCKSLYGKRKNFHDTAFAEGQVAEQQKEAEAALVNELKEKQGTLETQLSNLAVQVKNLTDKVDLLMESDVQAIKAWLKDEHEKWTHLGWIDNFSLDLIKKRYAIYVKEHGNSWAEDLMRDIDKLSVITPVDIAKLKQQ